MKLTSFTQFSQVTWVSRRPQPQESISPNIQVNYRPQQSPIQNDPLEELLQASEHDVSQTNPVVVDLQSEELSVHRIQPEAQEVVEIEDSEIPDVVVLSQVEDRISYAKRSHLADLSQSQLSRITPENNVLSSQHRVQPLRKREEKQARKEDQKRPQPPSASCYICHQTSTTDKMLVEVPQNWFSYPE